MSLRVLHSLQQLQLLQLDLSQQVHQFAAHADQRGKAVWFPAVGQGSQGRMRHGQ